MKDKEIESNRAAWLAQLRDPEAGKALGMLEDPNDPNQRCCLGHACHALGADRKLYDGKVWYGKDLKSPSALPSGVMDALAMWGRDGDFRASVSMADVRRIVGRPARLDEGIDDDEKEWIQSLSALNDGTDLTPAEIADVIEANWENLTA